jgi:hypothetical protein
MNAWLLKVCACHRLPPPAPFETIVIIIAA